MKATYYLATSLDGFIADAAGGVGWLDEVNVNGAGSSYGEFYSSVDGLMMGRATYDFVFDYGTWPYDNKPSWVATSRPLEPLAGANLQAATEIGAAWNNAQSSGIQHLWVVGGGKLAGALMQQQRLTHIHVTIMPILLGDGIPLVSALPAPQFLTQEQVIPGNGSSDIIYRVGA